MPGAGVADAESCVDDSAFTETLNLPSGPVQLECAGVPTLLSTVQVTECSAVAGRAAQLGMAEIFTADMQAKLIASCPAACAVCSAQVAAAATSSSANPDADAESCVDDSAYTETLNLPSGPVQLECAGVPTLLSTVQVTECSAVAGRAAQLGMAEIFTADMQAKLIASCPAACAVCSAQGTAITSSLAGQRHLLAAPSPSATGSGARVRCAAACSNLPNNTCCDAGACAFSYHGACEATQTFTRVRNAPTTVTRAEAEAIVRGWELHWLEAISGFTERFEHIAVSHYAARSFEDILVDAASAQMGFIAIGYALVVVYIVLFFTVDCGHGGCAVAGFSSERTSSPGAIITIIAVAAIGLSTFAALGIAGLLVSAGVGMSALTLQILPFLSLGLGINDFFVLAGALGEVMRSTPELDAEDTMARCMAEGGVSVTLSSLGNACAFFLAALTPLPAVRHFAIHVGICVVCNYLVAVLVHPAMLAMDVRRVKKYTLRRETHSLSLELAAAAVGSPVLRSPSAVPDSRRSWSTAAISSFGCHRPTSEDAGKAASRSGFDAGPHHLSISSISTGARKGDEEAGAGADKRVPLLGAAERMVDSVLDPGHFGVLLRVAVLTLYGGFLAWSIVGVTRLSLGLEMTDVVPSGTYLHEFAKENTRFDSYPVSIMGDGTIDYPKVMQELFDLEYDFVMRGGAAGARAGRGFEGRQVEPPGLGQGVALGHGLSRLVAGVHTSRYTAAQYCQRSMCDDEVQWVYDKFEADEDQCVIGGERLSNQACRARCDILSESGHCPQNPSNDTQRCVYTETECEEHSASCHCPYVVLPSEASFYSQLNAFLYEGGIQGEVAASFLNFDSKGRISASKSQVYVLGAGTLDEKLEHAAQESGQSGALFAFDVSVYALSDQYLHIRTDTLFVLAMAMIGAAAVMAPLLVHPLMLVVNICVVILIEVELYGMLTFQGLKLNGVVTVNLVMSIAQGKGVEQLDTHSRLILVTKLAESTPAATRRILLF
ncbi:hypothetical protein CYMTET_10521 [Cymbomonas tetramitiformis]|uniref:SSD domain-containing protein n=1 Tax=Cymbomonas tetramitiformis TaxID=36881 RepID=A0AAE0GQJ6_9CHLO|nr:hypothetical protein CYMTET_10521 [Cymbomonas tetramitiformis]